ncbi:MAG: hypothetical protein KGY38_05460 [Desulfobacterales bacterium]|nr:hypothetical protein [Desulfobacterales bacterium]
MKLARTEIMQACEKHLLKLIVKNIDKSALREAIREKYELSPGDEISFYNGDLVVRNNEIAYRLDFSVQANLSLLLSRNGEHIEISASEKMPDEAEIEPDSGEDESGRRIAAEIAQMISEINQ